MGNNNLYKIENTLRSIAKRYKSVKYSLGLAILFLMMGVSAFSEEAVAQQEVMTNEQIAESKENLKDLEIKVFEYFDVEKLRFIEDFNDYDGIMLSFMEENYYLYRKDFDSDIKMLEKALEISNVDSWDNFSIDKFRLKIHK